MNRLSPAIGGWSRTDGLLGLRLLAPVLGATAFPVGHTGGVQRPTNDVVADARQILNAASPNQHDRVFLKIVALARNVGGDLHLIGQADPGDLPKGRVRLLR